MSESSSLGLPLSGGDERISPISDATLRKFNIAGLLLHGIQGTAMLVASQAVSSIKSFRKDITMAYLEFDEETQTLLPAQRRVGSVEIGVAAAVFVLLSAVAHGLVLIFWDTYIRDINRGINRARWYEYALSSSVMICSIAVLFGCYDMASLILMFLVNAAMNFFGLLMEQMNPPGGGKSAIDWSPFVFGCVTGMAPWIVICMYFFGSGNYSQVPAFVYGILIGYFLFFNTFPVRARCMVTHA
jgi:hypothetical protein|eukprot:SAG25_NODE_970_length_4484_cov_3.700114_1_plen_243_part_00